MGERIEQGGGDAAGGCEKARRAMALTGLPCGLGSEGSFGGGPMPGLLPGSQGLVVLVDDALGIELVGRAEGAFAYPHEICTDVEAVLGFTRAQPEGQYFIMRPDHADHPEVDTGVLGEAASDLVAKWLIRCPAWGAPGFEVETIEHGLICGGCGLPTERVRARIHQYRLCPHTPREPVPGPADPAHCQRCNP